MRDVAIVSVAQSAHRRAVRELNEVEMVQPIIGAAMNNVGVSISDIDFTCSGSSDYLAGQAFSFVMTLDAVGAFPPIVESHVEMDGAWALYEAWLKIQSGHASTALVYSYGKSSPGDLPRVLSRQLDPYYYQPLWPDSIAVAGLQASAMLAAGVTTKQEMAEIAARSRTAAASNPYAQLTSSAPASELLAGSADFDPLHRHDCAPISDGGVAVILAADGRARELVDRPAWITGIAHATDSHQLGSRDLTVAPSVGIAARAAGVTGDYEIAELHAPFTHQEVLIRNELGLGASTSINPSGGALAANPMMAAGLIRLAEVAQRIMAGEVSNGVAHATSGQCLQQNLVATMEAK